MYAKVYRAMRNAVSRCGTQQIYRKVKFVGDAVNHIAQQVEAVYCQDMDAYGIKRFWAFLVVNGYNGVALL